VAVGAGPGPARTGVASGFLPLATRQYLYYPEQRSIDQGRPGLVKLNLNSRSTLPFLQPPSPTAWERGQGVRAEGSSKLNKQSITPEIS
jgi:hypothetical protein